MEKKRIKHPFNYNFKKDTTFEKPIGDSLTVLGESYTIAELMHRASNGLGATAYREGIYDDDPDFDDIDLSRAMKVDLTEQEELMEYQLEIDIQKAKQKTTTLEDSDKKAETVKEANKELTSDEPSDEATEKESANEQK